MSRTHAPRVRALVDDDFLLDRVRVAKRLGIHEANVWNYCRRFTVLANGLRVIRTVRGTRGRMKLLRSALIEHMHIEALVGADNRDPSVPLPVETVVAGAAP